MIWLIWYIKAIFCNHDFEYEEQDINIKVILTNICYNIGKSRVIFRRCKKCGWLSSKTKW